MAGAATSLEAEDWPQWRGPERNGVATESALLTQWPEEGPKELWSTTVGTGASSIAVADGRLFTMGNRDDQDHVYCLNAVTGEVLWRHSYACPFDKRMFEGGTTSTPTVDGDRVYTLSYKGDLYCLRAENGEVLWSKDLARDFGARTPQWGFAGSPLVARNLLIVETGAANGSLLALNKLDGTLVWHAGDAKAAYSSPMLFNNEGNWEAVIFNARGLYGHRLRDGHVQWSYRWKTDYDINATTPIIASNRIFISSGYGTGSAVLDFRKGRPETLWKSVEFANQLSSSVRSKGHLYGFHGNTGKLNSALRCVEFNTGKVVWSQAGFGTGTIILVDRTLVILSEKGELVLAQANPIAYMELARMQVLRGRSWVAPAFANGTLYCRNNRGDLAAFDLSPDR